MALAAGRPRGPHAHLLGPGRALLGDLNALDTYEGNLGVGGLCAPSLERIQREEQDWRKSLGREGGARTGGGRYLTGLRWEGGIWDEEEEMHLG